MTGRGLKELGRWHHADVSPKAIEGARKALAEIERQQQRVSQATEVRDPRLAAHYRLLLERWHAAQGNSSESGGK